MWREVTLLKKKKPVVVSIGDVAASGGYYIACAADKIYAEPSSITGSIGVFGLIPNMKKLFNERFGITFDEVSVTKNAVFGGITKPLNDYQSALAQRNVEKVYREFKERVAVGRNITVDAVEDIAQGRVWTGNQGLGNGLVDELGNMNDAIKFAVEKAGIKDFKLKSYPETKDFRQQLAESLKEMKAGLLKEELGAEYEVYKSIRKFTELKGTLCRLPYHITIE
jgi:protease-4